MLIPACVYGRQRAANRPHCPCLGIICGLVAETGRVLGIDVLDLTGDLPQRPTEAKWEEEGEEVDEDVVTGEDELGVGDLGDRGARTSEGRPSACIVNRAVPRLLEGEVGVSEGKEGESEQNEDAKARNASSTPRVETH